MADDELIFSDALVFLCLLLFDKLDFNNDILRMIGFELNREEREEFERREREVREENEFKDHVEKIVGVKIRPIKLNRLCILHQLIANGETIEQTEKDENSPLGFSKITVKQPEFYDLIRKRFNPTWIVYELLRQIGVRYDVDGGIFRHAVHKTDFMLHYVWRFDRAKIQEHRLRDTS